MRFTAKSSLPLNIKYCGTYSKARNMIVINQPETIRTADIDAINTYHAY